MKKLLIITAILALGTVSTFADFQWFNEATNRITYADGTTPLAYSRTDSSVGCFVQLIWAGANNSIDAAQLSGDGTTGDDQVAAFYYMGNTGWGDQAGIQPNKTAVTGDQPGYYYVRAWTAPSDNYGSGLVPTASSNYFGNSALWNNPGTEPPGFNDEFNFGGDGGWACTMQVPEPSFVALAFIGLLTIRLVRRKKA